MCVIWYPNLINLKCRFCKSNIAPFRFRWHTYLDNFKNMKAFDIKKSNKKGVANVLYLAEFCTFISPNVSNNV